MAETELFFLLGLNTIYYEREKKKKKVKREKVKELEMEGMIKMKEL